jgi:hypothetical protein
MDKKTLLKKLDDGVSSLRGILQENDGSTLKAIAASANQGFKSLKEAFEHSEKAQKAMAEIKKQCADLEEAVKKGDKKLSAKLLAVAERKILKYKEKFTDQESPAPKPKQPAKPARKAPAKTASVAAKTKKSTPAGAKPVVKATTASSSAAKKTVKKKPATTAPKKETGKKKS